MAPGIAAWRLGVRIALESDVSRIKMYDPSGKGFKLDGKPFFVWEACLACDSATIVDVSGECALEITPVACESLSHRPLIRSPHSSPSPHSRYARSRPCSPTARAMVGMSEKGCDPALGWRAVVTDKQVFGPATPDAPAPPPVAGTTDIPDPAATTTTGPPKAGAGATGQKAGAPCSGHGVEGCDNGSRLICDFEGQPARLGECGIDAATGQCLEGSC